MGRSPVTQLINTTSLNKQFKSCYMWKTTPYLAEILLSPAADIALGGVTDYENKTKTNRPQEECWHRVSPQHTEIFGVGKVAPFSLPGAQQTSRKLRVSVPSCLSTMSTHPGTVCAGCREGVKRSEKEGSAQHWPQLVRAQLTHSPLAACAYSRAGSKNWLLTYLQRDWWDSTLWPQPSGQCSLLTSVHNRLDFWLTPNLRFFRARVGMDKDRCQILLWHFKYDHGSRTRLSQYPLLVLMYS